MIRWQNKRVRAAAFRRCYASSRQERQQGFTLIEVLLSLALTAMLLSLLSAGMYVVARDWNAESNALEAQLDEAMVLLQIERALLAATPHSFNNLETLVREIYFEGESDSLRWVSALSPQRQGGLMAWSLEAGGNDGIELRLAAAYSDEPSQRLDDADSRLVLPGFGLEVSYLREPDENTREWTDEWLGSEQAALPLAVRLLFTRRDGEDLELVAPIKAWRHRSIMPTGLGAGLGQ